MTEPTDPKAKVIWMLARDPFYDILDLDDRERAAALSTAHGRSVIDIARRMAVSKPTAYRLIDAAAAKIGAALGIKVTRDNLVEVAWNRMKAATLP